jgi:hypothetical protein
MSTKSKGKIKVKDLKPKKDARGGGASYAQGAVSKVSAQGAHTIAGGNTALGGSAAQSVNSAG